MEKPNAFVDQVVVKEEDPLACHISAPFLQRTFVMVGEEILSQESEDQLSDPLAIDPLSVCTDQLLNMDIKNEEKLQNLDLCQKQGEERNKTVFPMVIFPEGVFTEETPLNFEEEDPLSYIPEAPLVSRTSLLVKNEPLDQASQEKDPLAGIPNVPVTPRNPATFKEDMQENDHFPNQPLESTITEFIQENLSLQRSVEKDPLSDIPNVPVTPRNPATVKEDMLESANFLNEPMESLIRELIQEESSLQRSVDGDRDPVFAKETSNEQHIPFRNEELHEEHRDRTLNGSFLTQNPSTSEEEINERRPIRKSAAAALASIHRSRVEYGQECSDLETESNDEYSIDSQSSDSEEDVHSASVKQNSHPTPLPPTAATITTITVTASASVLTTATPQSALTLSSLHQASCVNSEKNIFSDMAKEGHSSGCPHSEPEAHHRASASQLLQHLVHTHKNSSCLQRGQLSFDVTSDVQNKRMKMSRTPTSVATTISTSTTTAAVALSATESSGSTLSSLLQASSSCSEKSYDSGMTKGGHTSEFPHSHPEAHYQTSATQLLQHLVAVQKNRSHLLQEQLRSGFISSEVSKQDQASAGQEVLYLCKKRVSLLKPFSRGTVKNHLADTTKKRVESDSGKEPREINTLKGVKETLTKVSACGDKANSLILHSREQTTIANNFINRKRNEKCKENLLDLKHDHFEQCNDEAKSTVTKENLPLGEIIIHPITGLIVSKIPYESTNKNESVEKGFLYECLKCNHIFLCEQYQQTHNAQSNAEEHSFGCHKCEQRFALHHDLAVHYHEKHPFGRQFICPICHRVLAKKSNLKFHLRYVHSSTRSHVCQKCSMTFKNSESLQRHMLVHDNSNNFQCNVCHESFKRKVTLVRHMKSIHLGKKRTTKCHICDKIVLKTGLKRHLSEVHAAERNFQCNICDKKFVSKARLKFHINTVHVKQNKIHVCEICGKVEQSIGALRDHMNIHSEEKPYTCHVCGKNFHSKIKLHNHLVIHDEKKFKCDTCGYTCNRVDNLRTHIRSHTGVKPYTCALCNKAFTRSDNLQTHIRLVHNVVSSEMK